MSTSDPPPLNPEPRTPATEPTVGQTGSKRVSDRFNSEPGLQSATPTDTVLAPASTPPPPPPPSPPQNPTGNKRRLTPVDPRTVEQLAIRLRSEMFSTHNRIAERAQSEVTALYQLRERPIRETMIRSTRWSEVAVRLGRRIYSPALGARLPGVVHDTLEIHRRRLWASPLEPWATWLSRLNADADEMVRITGELASEDANIRVHGIRAIDHKWATWRCDYCVRQIWGQRNDERVQHAVAGAFADALLKLDLKPLPTGKSLGEFLDECARRATHPAQREVDENRLNRTPPRPQSPNRHPETRAALQAIVRIADNNARSVTRAAMIRLIALAPDIGGQPPDLFALAVLRAMIHMADSYSAAQEVSPPAWVIEEIHAAVRGPAGGRLSRTVIEATLAACSGASDPENAIARAETSAVGVEAGVVRSVFAWLHRLGQRGMPAAIAAELEYSRPDAGPINVTKVRNAIRRLRDRCQGNVSIDQTEEEWEDDDRATDDPDTE